MVLEYTQYGMHWTRSWGGVGGEEGRRGETERRDGKERWGEETGRIVGGRASEGVDLPAKPLLAHAFSSRFSLRFSSRFSSRGIVAAHYDTAHVVHHVVHRRVRLSCAEGGGQDQDKPSEKRVGELSSMEEGGGVGGGDGGCDTIKRAL